MRLFLPLDLLCGGENYVALSDGFHSFFVNFVWWCSQVDRTSDQFYNTSILQKRQEPGLIIFVLGLEVRSIVTILELQLELQILSNLYKCRAEIL